MTNPETDAPEDADAPEPIIEIAAATLTGDIASFLIDRLRHYDVPFKHMSEDQQETAIFTANEAATHLVRQAVGIIAANGRESSPVSIEKVVSDGKKIQATLTIPIHDERRFALLDAVGSRGVLIVADADDYEGGELPKPEPDQRNLIAGEGQEGDLEGVEPAGQPEVVELEGVG